MQLSKIQLNQPGLHKFFGDIELDILEYIWRQNSMTIQEFVNFRQNSPTPLHANTITTVANRMVTKGLLIKERGIKSHRYQACYSHDILVGIIKQQVKQLQIELEM